MTIYCRVWQCSFNPCQVQEVCQAIKGNHRCSESGCHHPSTPPCCHQQHPSRRDQQACCGSRCRQWVLIPIHNHKYDTDHCYHLIVPIWDATAYFSRSAVKRSFDLQAIDDLSDCRRVYSEPATLSLVAVFHSVSTFGDLAPKLSLNVLGAVVLVASDWLDSISSAYLHILAAMCPSPHLCYNMLAYDLMQLWYVVMQPLEWSGHILPEVNYQTPS